MGKEQFLAELRAAVEATTDDALAGTPFSSRKCPWIEYWFGYYGLRNAAQIERALRLYVPDAAAATEARALIPYVERRVRRAIGRWVQTGEVTDVPTEAAGPGSDVAAHTDAQSLELRLGPGARLESPVRSRMEAAFGVSLGHVRIHDDNDAGRLASGMKAGAFAVGNHVAFAPGRYRPGTLVGDAMLAHELAHVLQQDLAGPTGPRASSPLQSAVEADADHAALEAMIALRGRESPRGTSLWRQVGPRLRTGLRLSLSNCGGSGEPHPTAISSTVPTGPPLHYGSAFTHTFNSSTGRVADLDGIVIGERVTVGRDDFATGWGGVALGTITATTNNLGRINDTIGTPAGAIHAAMPHVASLPAVLETPQTLHWQNRAGNWVQFAAVPITFTVQLATGGTMEAVTVDNGVPAPPEPFTGPPPGGAAAPPGGPGGPHPAPPGGAPLPPGAPPPGGGGP